MQRGLGLFAGCVALGGAVAAPHFLQRKDVAFASTVPAQNRNREVNAVAVLYPEVPGVHGVVRFSQRIGEPTRIHAKVTGLRDGKHGFHVHEYGNLTQGCHTAGGHYNPFGKDHGGPKSEVRHVGDLGNIESKDGIAEYRSIDSLVQLTGPYSVIGRSVVVHADEDDLGKGKHPDSKTTGHAGGRVACGVIGMDKDS